MKMKPQKLVFLVFNPGNTNKKGRLGTIDLLFKVACFVKKVIFILNIEMSSSKLVSTRRSNVLSLPLH